jgi:hypothetical protein
LRSLPFWNPGTSTNHAVVLVGSTWATMLTEERKLDAFDTQCLQKILGIRWFQRVWNSDTATTTFSQSVEEMALKVVWPCLPHGFNKTSKGPAWGETRASWW